MGKMFVLLKCAQTEAHNRHAQMPISLKKKERESVRLAYEV